jgi:hypothetical protein
MTSWLDLITAALGGGFVVKLLDVAYTEFRRRDDKARSASDLVEHHLDPLLKSADGLLGRLLALARSDFRELRSASPRPRHQLSEPGELANLAYHFAAFWARLEILRRESIYVALSRDALGKKLLAFIDCLESRKNHLLERSTQRAIGEIMIADHSGTRECMSFAQFVERTRADASFAKWIAPLGYILVASGHTTERQQILHYAVILHAFVDSLDPQHLISRNRRPCPNKLTRKTMRDLRYRVFGTYLTFVTSVDKYLDPSWSPGNQPGP